MLRALRETDGTHEVVNQEREYEDEAAKHILGKWVSSGRADKRQTAYAKFAQHYYRVKSEHCNADVARNREFDHALQILERTCDCGKEKMTLPDGTLGDACRQCQDLDDQGRPPRRST